MYQSVSQEDEQVIFVRHKAYVYKAYVKGMTIVFIGKQEDLPGLRSFEFQSCIPILASFFVS